MDDKRRCSRWQTQKKSCLRMEGSATDVPCIIHDINLRGAKISSTEKFAPDSLVKLKLILSHEFGINVEAWVAWQKSVDGFHIYGLYFTKIADADKEKIYRFMRHNFPKEVDKHWWKEFKEEKGGETMEEKKKFEDRRIFERFPATMPLRFLDLTSNQEGTAQTLDISAKGIGLVSSEQVQPRTTLEMWLDVPDKGDPLYTRGEVAWSKLQGESEYRVGVNLEKADLMGLARALRAV